MKKFITIDILVTTTRTNDEAADMIRDNLRTVFLSTEIKHIRITDFPDDFPKDKK